MSYGLKTLEAVVQRCSVKKVLLEILQNSQENTCARDSFLKKLQASRFYRTPPETILKLECHTWQVLP